MDNMAQEDLDKFEKEASRAFERMGEHVPVSETSVLDDRVPRILVDNAKKHGDVVYTSSGNEYSVSFGFAEIRMEDGNLGLYNELPEDLDPDDAETLAFMVLGLHKKEETEIQFSEGKILLNQERIHGHIVDFQRAVLLKGSF